MDTRKLQHAIRYHVLSDQTVRDLIGNNVYPSELATVASPEYPCVNFRMEPGMRLARVNETFLGDVQVWAWSNSNYDEASKVIDAIEDKLGSDRVETNEIYAVFTTLLTPQQLYDEEAKIYGYVMRFRIYAIER